MNKTQFNEIYQNELTPPQRKVLSGFLKGKTDKEILDIIESSDRTAIIRHIKNICEKFGIKKSDYWRKDLLKLFMQYRPDLFKINDLPLPGCVEPLNSPYYIERNNCESRCYQEITKPGSLIRIKAPKQMGKTSLIKRITRESENINYHVVQLNFSIITQQKLTNIDSFLRGFYAYFQSEFELASNLEEWDKDLPSTLHCTRQIQTTLQTLDRNLVLILDEVDKLFPFPEIYQDFFPMLRYWYEKSRDSEVWEKLRLVIAHSTQYYGKLDINSSPFGNVGLPIKLEEFTLQEVQKLVFIHEIRLDDAKAIMQMIGGHPYLIRLAFYQLSKKEIKINQLVTNSSVNESIYHPHLQEILTILKKEPELLIAFQQILNQTLDRRNTPDSVIFKLEGTGLIKLEGNKITVRCKLYQLYFSDRLLINN